MNKKDIFPITLPLLPNMQAAVNTASVMPTEKWTSGLKEQMM